jgi:hypothetical protein
LSARGALLRILAAGLIRNLVPYGIASIAAAALVVACVFTFQVSSGANVALGGFAVALAYGSIITFVLALPTSAFFIAIGEWKGFGKAYHVAAGTVSAVVSYGAIVMPQQPDNDFLTLAFVTLGGAFGGGVFTGTRKVLVSMLGELGKLSIASRERA